MQAKSYDAQPCLKSKLDDLPLGQFDAYRREAVDEQTIAAIAVISRLINGCQPSETLH